MEPDKIIAIAKETGDAEADSRGRITYSFDEHGLTRFAALYEQALIAEGWRKGGDDADTERLRSLAWPDAIFDSMGDVDLHEEASINASAFGRDEPNSDDYLTAIRTAIDRARSQP